MNPAFRQNEAKACPPDELLAAFMAGKPENGYSHHEIESHLSECETCQDRASTLEPDQFQQQLAKLDSWKPTNTRLTGKYELVEEIGRGGCGIVYRAMQPGLERTVALKMLIHGAHADSNQLARFHRECASLARLNHPNIIDVYDSGEQDGIPYLAMELVDGPTLGNALKHRLPSPVDAASIVAALSGAVGAAHQAGIIHRDLKPQNVLLDNFSDTSPLPNESFSAATAKISDFGLSQFDDDEAFKTQTGQALGTPGYMSPEMALADKTLIGPATDIYGLGAILYECLTGRAPFTGSSAAEIISGVIGNEIVPVRKLRPSIPTDLATICERCLAKKPNERFPDALALQTDLERFLNGKPIQSRPVSRLEKSIRWARRNPWPVGVVAVIIVSITALMIVLSVNQSRLKDQRDGARLDYQSARQTIWNILDATDANTTFDIPRLYEISAEQSEAALELFEKLAAKDDTISSRRDLATIRLRVGNLMIASGRAEKGAEQLTKSRQMLNQLVEESPDDASIVGDLVRSQVKLSLSWSQQGQHEKALTLLRETLESARLLARRVPANLSFQDNVSWVHHSLGSVYVENKQHAQAEAEFAEAVQLRKEHLEIAPENDDLRTRLSESQVSLGLCQMANGKMELADQSALDAIDTLQQLHRRNPKDTRPPMAIAVAQLNRSNLIANEQKDLPGAVAACTDGIEWLVPILEADPNHFGAKNYLSMLYGNRALFHMENKQWEQSLMDWKNATETAVVDSTKQFCQVMWVRTLVPLNRINDAISMAEQLPADSMSHGNRIQLAMVYGLLAKQSRDDDALTEKLLIRAHQLLDDLRMDESYSTGNAAFVEVIQDHEDLELWRNYAIQNYAELWQSLLNSDPNLPD